MDSLYIHIPFCVQLCSYCDFHKEIANPHKMKAYIEALKTELKYHQNDYKTLQTIYVGGGTPSTLPLTHLDSFLSALHVHIDMESIKEFTFEANPKDITPSLIKRLKHYGVNRVSLGAQTFDAAQLSRLKRDHTPSDIERAINILHRENLTNISLDMLFGLPNQTLKDLKHDLKRLETLKVKHISYYSLILEPNTRLYHQVTKQKLTLPNEEIVAQMYETVMDRLNQMGFHQYEVSSFSKNAPSLHNQLIWQDHDYLGIGSGAHGKYNDMRYFNTPRIKTYIETLSQTQAPPKESYPYEAKRDFLLMGMRLLKGVSLRRYYQRFESELLKDYPSLKPLIKLGFLTLEHDHLAFSKKGLMVGNNIFELF